MNSTKSSQTKIYHVLAGWVSAVQILSTDHRSKKCIVALFQFKIRQIYLEPVAALEA